MAVLAIVMLIVRDLVAARLRARPAVDRNGQEPGGGGSVNPDDVKAGDAPVSYWNSRFDCIDHELGEIRKTNAELNAAICRLDGTMRDLCGWLKQHGAAA